MSDSMKWEKLSSRYLVKEKWATLRVDACKMPDGTIIDDYYVLEYPDWVNAVAVTEDNEVILIRQYRHASGEVILEVPGGCIDPGESPEEAVKRELLEETGYAFSTIEPMGTVYANPSTSANKTHSFLLTGGKKCRSSTLTAGKKYKY
ncbi:NUDIX hydrolase [Arcticibacter sp. MXS-1]|uniref:NUDIX hydrolase n=1 Tax=Arcticibacter sp. MXS-1 TaxID=3341726 RepID=UPI0035A8BBF3